MRAAPTGGRGTNGELKSRGMRSPTKSNGWSASERPYWCRYAAGGSTVTGVRLNVYRLGSIQAVISAFPWSFSFHISASTSSCTPLPGSEYMIPSPDIDNVSPISAAWRNQRTRSHNFSTASPGAPNLTKEARGLLQHRSRPARHAPARCPYTGRERDQDNDGAKPNVPRTALNRFSLGHVELLSGIRKLNFGLLEFLHEPKIDGLLHIHVCVVIGAEHN